ncbi:hypothetical protein DPMN_039900 [Dreissena polymorpha]|uniref:Uncharacterized protein n=1 Tax=Dreissena polymorpha TaxID=45954 RepID=A0A9D4CU81_DREPO|nr:hypothetical protein DPMN_039900 [Dreissena polymorpha]
MEQIKLQHQKKIQLEENAKKKEKMPKSTQLNTQTTCKSPKATTSGLQINQVNQHGKDDESETDDEDQSDLCCVCGRSSPPQLKDIHSGHH